MFSVFGQWLANVRIANDRRRAIKSLSRLSDAQLLDIGIERGTIEEHVNEGLPWEAWEAYSVRPLRSSLQGCG
jgi:Domain of unknown function (DUF1127)